MSRTREWTVALAALALSAGAAAVLQAAPGPSPELQAKIDGLIRKMGESDTAGRDAHRDLIALGVPAVPALIKAADDPLPLRRWWSVSALCAIGDTRAVQTVLAHMRDRHPTVRYVAIYNARSFVHREPRVAEAMTAALRSRDTGDVQWAVRGLGDAKYLPALPQVKAAAACPDPEVRWWLMQAVVEMEGPVAAVPFLAERLRTDSEPAVRIAAVGALGKTRIVDQRVIGAVIGALRDRSPKVRVAAFRGVQLLTGETFDFVAEQDVPGDVAKKVIAWWLDNREKYPAVGKPGPATRP